MDLKRLKAKMQRQSPSDITGLDLGKTAVKIVRFRKQNNAITFCGAEETDGWDPLGNHAYDASSIPSQLKARYVSLVSSSKDTIIKLLTFPGNVGGSFEQELSKTLGLPENHTHRMGYRVLTEGSGRIESRVLATALPESEATLVMKGFHTGIPAPFSLEVSPLAVLTVFETIAVLPSKDMTVGLLDIGYESTTLSIYNKKNLILVRRFDFGTRQLQDRLTTALHVDSETVQHILSDSAFDISEMLSDMMGPFASQLIVSRDFAERRDNCSLKSLYMTGSPASSPALIQEFERALGLSISIFDPFDIPDLQLDNEGTLPPEHRWRFAAAIGAALGTLQEGE